MGLADAFLDGVGLPAQGSAIVSVGLPQARGAAADAGLVVGARAGRARLAFQSTSDEDDVQRAVVALR